MAPKKTPTTVREIAGAIARSFLHPYMGEDSANDVQCVADHGGQLCPKEVLGLLFQELDGLARATYPGNRVYSPDEITSMKAVVQAEMDRHGVKVGEYVYDAAYNVVRAADNVVVLESPLPDYVRDAMLADPEYVRESDDPYYMTNVRRRR